MVKPLKLILVSTPIGFLGSGKGGGVELTLTSLIKGLLNLGHQIILIAPEKSKLPFDSSSLKILEVQGTDQLSCQHQDYFSPIVFPIDSVLPKLWEKVLSIDKDVDAILNFGYDWLPLWLTPIVSPKIFHLISMGAVSEVMKQQVRKLSNKYNSRLAFHTHSQASDYELMEKPKVLGNGFDLKEYKFQSIKGGPLGWAGRVAPEKGLEDAATVASSLGTNLLVWGLIEDKEYARSVENSFPKGTINWRGFLETKSFQKELGNCSGLINTPKWNEAYGNVVVEAMACGVPVVAYKRGGPGELINSGNTGWLVPPDDIHSLIQSTKRIGEIDRHHCRKWVEDNASQEVFAKRISSWINEGIFSEKKPLP